jgi:hypothetical protein
MFTLVLCAIVAAKRLHDVVSEIRLFPASLPRNVSSAYAPVSSASRLASVHRIEPVAGLETAEVVSEQRGRRVYAWVSSITLQLLPDVFPPPCTADTMRHGIAGAVGV